MGIVLGPNQYGKAENRLVRIYRETERHEIRDITVTTALRGDFAAAHLAGDQAQVLPTDTQKNTCYAYAKERGLREIEEYALGLARHFVDDVEPVTGATISVDELGWQRAQDHDHTWVRTGPEVRTTEVTVDAEGTTVTSGLKDLVLLKSTGSEFAGFLKDEYTTLAETHDRIMATSLVARWRYTGSSIDSGVQWDKTWADVRTILIDRFANVHSLALQQTLWEMGRAVLEAHASIAEIRLAAPNKHHFLVDLAPFGLENPGEVFYAADRPYGLIEASVVRE
ncbi:factor-independent urate hydroxylase [Pseudonocardia sp. CA-107938]|uniref:factor-independent urate hydroxylase n=1 Tax=Pseudonocardia sp. CA-107938 TaxID=3240021 RepID=UPI003D8E30DF